MKTRIIITIPGVLKRAMTLASISRECSQAEVIRTALYEHLKDLIQRMEANDESS